MSIDTLTISLTGPLAEEVRAAAEARGLTPEDYVRQRLAWDIAIGADDASEQPGVEEDVLAFEDFERTGVGLPWEEVRDWLGSWGTGAERPRPAPRKLR